MSREIKFRGLRVEPQYHQSKWKFGNLLNDKSIGDVGYGLESYQYAQVISESVGQFTGLKDKNGVDGYEGDKVILQYGRHHTAPNGKVREGIIKFDKKLAAFVIAIINSKVIIPFSIVIDFEVIGNIHETK